jgi:hypothetical protein
MNAENALNDRQSRFVCGFAKLNAKMMKTSEFIKTRDHRPYADSCVIFRYLRYHSDGLCRDLGAHRETNAEVGIAATNRTAEIAPRAPDALSRENSPRSPETRVKRACF